jgi:hypothetical protein
MRENAVADAPISIVLIHWKIKKELAADFEQSWKTVFTVKNREGLIGEFLSKIERRDQTYPYITWPIICENPDHEENCVHYINVALWNSHQRFFDEVGSYMKDDKPICEFEIERRRRVSVTPTEWRVSTGRLPAEDSEGTK